MTVSRSRKTCGPPSVRWTSAASGTSLNPAMFWVMRMTPVLWSRGPGDERPAATISPSVVFAASIAASALATSALTTASGPVCGVTRASRPMSATASPSMRATAVRMFVPPRSKPR